MYIYINRLANGIYIFIQHFCDTKDKIFFALIKKIFLQTLVEIIFRSHYIFYELWDPPTVQFKGTICLYIGGLMGFIYIYPKKFIFEAYGSIVLVWLCSNNNTIFLEPQWFKWTKWERIKDQKKGFDIKNEKTNRNYIFFKRGNLCDIRCI